MKKIYDINGYDRFGYNKYGFNSFGIHKETGTQYNPAGYNEAGYDKDGYDREGNNRYGFNRRGIHKKTGTEYNPAGYNRDGYNRDGFNISGIHKETGTQYNPAGYNKAGYDKDGYDRDGNNRDGFNRSGIHKKTGTEYNPAGYNRDGYNRDGFNRKGIHRETGTRHNTKGFNIDGWDKDGYNIKGHHIEGYDDEGYDKNGYDRNGVDKEGINRKTGEKDERVEFAEGFIASGKSIEQFAKEKQLPVEEVTARIEEIRTSPCISDAIRASLNRNANRFLGTVKTKKEQLLSGEITITDIRGIDNIFRLCNPDERKKVTEMLIQAMASHEISILQYKNILEIKEINSSLPQNIITQIEALKRSAGPLTRELYKEMDRLKPYRTPYIANEGEALGYMEKPTDKKPKMVTITAEHRDMARQYLKATDEFICNKTMQSTLMKIIKGEIGIEQIVRVQKESELRRLQQEDGELGELIEQSEQFIKASQEKTQTGPDIDDKGE